MGSEGPGISSWKSYPSRDSPEEQIGRGQQGSVTEQQRKLMDQRQTELPRHGVTTFSGFPFVYERSLTKAHSTTAGLLTPLCANSFHCDGFMFYLYILSNIV